MKRGLIALMVAVPLLLGACTAEGGGAAPPAPAGGAPLPQATAAGAYTSYTTSQQFGLWVTGRGRITYAPDVVVLQLGVEAQAPTVAAAQAQARDSMVGVLAALEDKGIAEKDIQTTRFSIQPVYEWIERMNKQELTGYRVTNQVRAKIRQVDAAGEVIDAVAEAGGDLVRIEGISFSIDDPSPLQAQARELAVKEAVAKAQQIAGAAGIELGQVIYINETTLSMPTPVPFVQMEARAAMAAPPPTEILPGELELSVQVQVVYSIK
ncbi:MAG: SIMPL domain-containing protein [Dehalococcoidia bacterium]